MNLKVSPGGANGGRWRPRAEGEVPQRTAGLRLRGSGGVRHARDPKVPEKVERAGRRRYGSTKRAVPTNFAAPRPSARAATPIGTSSPFAGTNV